ncbi:response regulator [Halobaculum sp. D14]|uniref:response regulator n=1 Tax=Halobaculum sp. D14 TaxID=3421642 RepID=UPI003EC0DD10
MSESTISVLHVDDEAPFLDLVKTYLERDDDIRVVSVSGAEEAIQKFDDEEVDCIVSDYRMPEMNGISLLNAIRSRAEDFPFILYTGQGSEEIASEAITAGVSDYVQKGRGRDHYELLIKRIKNNVSKYETEQRIQQVYEAIDAVNEGVAICDESGTLIHVNQAYASVLGYDSCELIGEHWNILYRDNVVQEVENGVIPEAMDAEPWIGKARKVRKDGTEVIVENKLLFTSGGLMVCIIGDAEPADGTEPVTQATA